MGHDRRTAAPRWSGDRDSRGRRRTCSGPRATTCGKSAGWPLVDSWHLAQKPRAQISLDSGGTDGTGAAAGSAAWAAQRTVAALAGDDVVARGDVGVPLEAVAGLAHRAVHREGRFLGRPARGRSPRDGTRTGRRRQRPRSRPRRGRPPPLRRRPAPWPMSRRWRARRAAASRGPPRHHGPASARPRSRSDSSRLTGRPPR